MSFLLFTINGVSIFLLSNVTYFLVTSNDKKVAADDKGLHICKNVTIQIIHSCQQIEKWWPEFFLQPRKCDRQFLLFVPIFDIRTLWPKARHNCHNFWKFNYSAEIFLSVRFCLQNCLLDSFGPFLPGKEKSPSVLFNFDPFFPLPSLMVFYEYHLTKYHISQSKNAFIILSFWGYTYT